MTSELGVYDPEPDAPYGLCSTCGVVFQTKDDMLAHLSTTFKESTTGRGHSGRTTNPTREERIESAVQDAVDDAVDKFIDDIYRLQGDEVTDEEIKNALYSIGDVDLHQAWIDRD